MRRCDSQMSNYPFKLPQCLLTFMLISLKCSDLNWNVSRLHFPACCVAERNKRSQSTCLDQIGLFSETPPPARPVQIQNDGDDQMSRIDLVVAPRYFHTSRSTASCLVPAGVSLLQFVCLTVLELFVFADV